MGDDMITEGMLDMFIFETEQGLENLENICLESKDVGEFDEDNVNEIFRIMHTIKGSSAVMMFQNIATLAHKLEDVFYFIRESHPDDVPHDELVDDVLEVSDFITAEMEKIKDGEDPDEDPAGLIDTLDKFLNKIQKKTDVDAGQVIAEKQEKAKESEKPHFYIAPVASENSKFYSIYITYYKETEMANIRAYMAVNSLKGIAEDILYTPSDIISNPDSADVVLEFGFRIALQTTEEPQAITELIDSSAGIENIEIKECTSDEFLDFCVEAESKPASSAGDVLTAPVEKPTILVESQKPGSQKPEDESEVKTSEDKKEEPEKKAPAKKKAAKKPPIKKGEAQSFISVNIKKMDLLMDLIGELVIAEAVVLQNPDLKVPGLDLSNFQKSAAQLSKITSELQDAIMAMRMMPLKNTFQKMNRIVYDTSKKLGKDIELEVIGEDTEVDKNIIEHISDPLMHLIRNSVDHGIESNEERKAIGKKEKGKVVLEAKNEGGQVWISVSDNGKGLKKDEILEKAKANGLLGNKSEKDLTEKEIFNFITAPGFSTKKKVTEYSGRGVGMDVVVKNIQQVGGVLDIESVEGQGSTMTMKIPLTLAIIDGIIFSVGETNFVTPTNSVTEFIRVEKDKLIVEPDGEEYVMIRQECYPLIRLNRFYHLDSAVEEIEDGIVIILNHEDRKLAVFADSLVGEQEIVVKPIPSYVKAVKGISGCTQLGDGSISLILDTGGLVMN
ncbi:chemotaxis protein CheA [Eubacterium sp. MSJ-13]|uniref:chemotaxis protein CheA n=1 Tax=Eubacterium sp. MSJ-13 TaxID=2841513 RepID=UPI001C1276DA|nr:chemotaxis protein CheA [Eubacterium sp. MSJ-13]MBU5479197.1 chemotaxis protein CheA [Eubacterium sp. MSJ-13]